MLYESAHISLATDYRIATLKLRGDDERNLLNRDALSQLDAALRIVQRHPALDVLVIRGDRPGTFGIGPDLGELSAHPDGSEAAAIATMGQRVAARLAKLAPITVAYVEGQCLGGALELALACDIRVANGSAGTRFGFPQIRSGAIPCWGGTIRVPRAIGLSAALDLFLSCRKVSAAQARSLGLIQYAFPPSVARTECDSLALDLQADGRKPRARRVWSDFVPGRRGRLMRWASTEVQRTVSPDHTAPRELLRALTAGINGGDAEGFAAERMAMARLAPKLAAATPAVPSKPMSTEPARPKPLHTVANLRIRDHGPKPVRDPATAAKPMKRIGILGGGTVGIGLAQWAAMQGCTVAIQERDEKAVLRSRELLAKQFRRAVVRRLLPAEELADRIAAVAVSCEWVGFESTELVIEAVDEDRCTKSEVLRQAEKNTLVSTLFATASTAFTVRELQDDLARPERMLGLHIGHPVASMKWAEVTAGPNSHPNAVNRLRTWLRANGKRPLLVADRPGRVLGRVLLPYLHEAVLLAEEGYDVAAVDTAAKRFGLAWGPFETLDQIGLDVVLATMREMTGTVTQLSPPPLLERLVAAGSLGRKNEIGFYKHGRVASMPNVAALPKCAAGRDPDLGVRRAVARLLIASFSALGSGLIRNTEDLDGVILAAGWPAFRGGPVRYAYQRGLPLLIKICGDLTKRYGPRFEPGKEMRRRAGQPATIPMPRRAVAA